MPFYFILLHTSSTFVCPTEIIGFSDRISEFKELNAEVVWVSTDSHFSHLAWVNLARKVPNFSYVPQIYLINLNIILCRKEV